MVFVAEITRVWNSSKIQWTQFETEEYESMIHELQYLSQKNPIVILSSVSMFTCTLHSNCTTV